MLVIAWIMKLWIQHFFHIDYFEDGLGKKMFFANWERVQLSAQWRSDGPEQGLKLERNIRK